MNNKERNEFHHTDESIREAYFGHLAKHQVRKEDTLLGKEIRIGDGVRTNWSEGTVALIFTDATFAILEVAHEGHDDWGSVHIMEEPASPRELYGLDLVGRDEFDKYQGEIDKLYANSAKENRRERYLELKQEFGGNK